MSRARNRFTGFLGAAVAVVGLGASSPAQENDDPYLEDLRAAERHVRRGEFFKAQSVLDEILLDAEEVTPAEGGPGRSIVTGARREVLRLELLGGNYDRVVDGVAKLDADMRQDVEMRLLVARALVRRGDYERAQSVFEGLGDEDGLASGVQEEVLARRATLLLELGRATDARALLERIVDGSRRREARDARSLTWIGRAHELLGGRRNVEQASALYVEAARIDREAWRPRVHYGLLRYEVYGEWSGASSGEGVLKEVLDRNGDVEQALVALHRIRSENHLLDPSRTERYLTRALGRNPRSVPALLARGIRILDDRRFQDAIDMFDEALAVNPNDKHVLAQRSAAAHLVGDESGAEAFAARAKAVDAGFVGVDVALGDRLVALYRFADSIPHYEAALDADATDLDALHGLARALIYAGRGADAVELLERAAKLQPGYVHPWRHNALASQALLSEEYEAISRDGFVFFLHREDRAVLEEYLLPLQLEARTVLDAKYGHQPKQPVRIEVFRTWDDFSVRTIGFRGFTALGACFGPLITLVSPVDGDVRRQDFMWSATVWHEYVHVLTLELSAFRVPRWLTEGFSVHEEGQRDKTWERGLERDLLDAFYNDEIPPVRLLNRLFRGPKILFGYFLSGVIVDRLADEYGFDRTVDMLGQYAQDKSTEEAFRETFGISSSEFDRKFRDYIEQRIAPLKIVPRYSDRSVERLLLAIARDKDDLEAHLGLAWASLQRNVQVDAATHLREALRIAPDDARVQLVWAELLRRRDAFDEAVAKYEAGFAGGADDFVSRLTYAEILAGRGDDDGAVRQLLAAKRCWPACTDQALSPELRLARIHRRNGRETEAMMELKTFCKRTARAFRPRIELAAFERAAGNRQEEARLLAEAVQIDPFVKSVHLDLADALIALGRKDAAVRELRVALVVRPTMDRDYIDSPEEMPNEQDPEYRAGQAVLCVRLARLLHDLQRDDEAMEYLDRANVEAPGSDAAEEASELRAAWGQ